MTQSEIIAAGITHELRVKILTEWLPTAIADLSNPGMKALFEAYFIYIEPDGIRNTNCPTCIQNVLNNWKSLQTDLINQEQNYNLLNSID